MKMDYEKIFDSAPAQFLILNCDLDIVAANEAYLRATRTERNQVVGTPLFGEVLQRSIGCDPEIILQIKASFNKVIKTKAPDRVPVIKYSHVDPETSYTEDRYWSWVNQPMFADNGEVQYIIYRAEDVTDFVNLNISESVREELIYAKQVADAANAAKSAFVANISHEIRTPLAAIIGYSGFLLEPDKTPSEKHNCIMAIQRNSGHLANLVNEVLDLSKIEAGFLEVEPLTFGIAEIFEYVEAVSGYKAREKGLSFDLQISSSVPKYVKTDPTRLRQILTNVIGNALKFTERGSVKVTVDCERQPDKFRSKILSIGVRDTGIGISATRTEDVFTRFMQADSSTTRKFGGTGLGLQLSMRLAQALGGDVRLIESKLGHGSHFQITVEIGSANEVSQIEVEERIAERTEELVALQNESFRDMRILVVDDSEDNRDILKIMLKSTGAKIETAENGEAGIERALNSEFDVVLMDIQMPGIDGHEAAKRLRSKGFRKPILALTAHALKEDRERSIQSGCDDHITKPIRKDELVSAVAHYACKIKKISRKNSATRP